MKLPSLGIRGEVSKIIGIAVGLLVAAVTVPVSINAIMVAENMSTWNPAVVAVFSILLPVLAVIGIALYFIPKVKR